MDLILARRSGHLLTGFSGILESFPRAWYAGAVTDDREHVRARVIDMLGSCGAASITHPGGDLLTHLIRTEGILRAWDADDDVCRAGLAHAFYGTAGFPVSLGPLSARPVVRSVLGDRAEAIVYRYCSCHRGLTYATLSAPPVVFTDRFEGGACAVDDDAMHAFAIVTIANELDLVREAAFDTPTVLTIDALFSGLDRYAPEAAAMARAEIRAHYEI